MTLIKTWVLSLKLFLYNFFVFIEMSPGILKDENLQGREKKKFTIFSVMKFFEQMN